MAAGRVAVTALRSALGDIKERPTAVIKCAGVPPALHFFLPVSKMFVSLHPILTNKSYLYGKVTFSSWQRLLRPRR